MMFRPPQTARTSVLRVCSSEILPWMPSVFLQQGWAFGALVGRLLVGLGGGVVSGGIFKWGGASREGPGAAASCILRRATIVPPGPGRSRPPLFVRGALPPPPAAGQSRGMSWLLERMVYKSNRKVCRRTAAGQPPPRGFF